MGACTGTGIGICARGPRWGSAPGDNLEAALEVTVLWRLHWTCLPNLLR